MRKRQIRLYFKNVMSDVIGDEHGITDQQLADLGKKIEPLIPVVAEEMMGQKRHPDITRTMYGSLPENKDNAAHVLRVVDELKEKCDNLVILGIGGSALGNIAVQTALNPYMYNYSKEQRNGAPRLFVFDNVDPDQFGSFLEDIEDQLDRTIFNVISKSGRTAETAAQFLLIREMLAERGPEYLAEHIVITTGFETDDDGKPRSTLYRIAKEATPNLRLLEVPADVGGRFSVLSAVGLFSAAMCGIDIKAMLAGAADMHSRVTSKDFRQNPAAINAAINYHFYNNGKKSPVIMPYCHALKDMADWYRQLWAESLGKKVDLSGQEVWTGPTPIKALGATDQHSQVQLYREGPNDKLFTFLQIEEFDKENILIGPAPDKVSELDYLADQKMSTLLNSEKKATEYALLNDNRPCLTVRFDEVSAYTVGQFILFFEATTSFMGALLNIDTYNQPAVELVKEATFALMGRTGNYRSDLTYEEFAEQIRAKTDIDECFLI